MTQIFHLSFHTLGLKFAKIPSGGDRDGAQTSLRLNHQGKAEPFLCPLFLSESFSLYRLSIGHYLFFGCKGTADGMHQVPINLFSKNFSAAFRNQRWRFSINFLQNSLAFIPLLRSSASHRKKRQKRPTDRIKKKLSDGQAKTSSNKKLLPPSG